MIKLVAANVFISQQLNVVVSISSKHLIKKFFNTMNACNGNGILVVINQQDNSYKKLNKAIFLRIRIKAFLFILIILILIILTAAFPGIDDFW